MDLTTNCSTARRASLRARSSTTAIPIPYSDKIGESCVIPTMEIRKRMEFSRLRLTKRLKGTHTGKVMVNNVIQIVRKYHTNSFHGLPG
jgi:hypothetical protein